MFRDKHEIAGLFRSLVCQAGEKSPAEMTQQLVVLADRLEREHQIDVQREQAANQGTEECPGCHGSRTTFAVGGYVQCERCRGWGRVIEGEPR